MLRQIVYTIGVAIALWLLCVFMELPQEAINLVFLMWICMIVIGPWNNG